MSLRQRVSLALLFGSIFLTSLLILAPASLLGYLLERTTNGQLMLARTHGSLWNGSGSLLLQDSTSIRSLGNYNWRFQPWMGSLQLQAGSYEPMTVHVRPLSARIDIDNLRLDLPAALLAVAIPQLHPYRLQGTLQTHAAHLKIDAQGLDGAFTADWRHAASGLSRIAPLGDYRIVLQGDGQHLDARLDTLGGKLKLTVSGHLDPAKGMLINGTAQAAEGAQEELNELLHYIGPETQPGIYTLALMPQSNALP